MATNDTIVDLSEENDNTNTGTLAYGSQPPSNTPDAFERSCDNPECSAPKLISQVPKRDTSEFITGPIVMDQPTLINGFTTVFQIDGVGHRIEDLMNEAENAPGQNHKPKTIFRVVPNTHAHIVNYVVVDAAGETMRKIKANDPETIRKLLVSQRLSAEQMLKKLIGKALETPPRTDNSLSTVPMTGAGTLASVPVTQGALTSSSAVATTSTSKPNLALKVAPAAKLIPAPKLASAALKTAPAIKLAPAAKLTSVTKPTITPKPTPALTTKPASLLTSGSTTDPATPAAPPKVPAGITIKLLSSSDANKTPISSTASTSTVTSTPTSSQISKTISSLIQKGTLIPKPAVQPTPPRQPPAGIGRVIPASKPVVWQAVPPGVASKCSPTPLKTTPPRTVVSPRIMPSVTISPTKVVTSSNLSNSPPQQSAPESLQKDTEMLDLEKSITTSSIAVRRNLVADSQSNQQQSNILKRKIDTPSPTPEVIKRLRPRSPNRAHIKTPLAGNLPQSSSPTSTRKLPTLPKFQKLQVSNRPAIKRTLTENLKPEESAVTTANTDPDSNKQDRLDIEDDNISKPSPPAVSESPSRRKAKPLMGPASKMKAIKALSVARAKAEELKTAKSMKIGETIIRRTASMKSGKDSPQPGITLTKPCSVAITDIVKSNTNTDSDSDSITKKSKPTLRSSSDREQLTTEKSSDSPIDKLRGRWTINKDEYIKSNISRSPRTTRSKVANTTKAATTEHNTEDEILDSTLLTTPSAPSRVLRVVLPSQKNGIVNNPATSPHPNLMISSVISGGTPLSSASLPETDAETIPVIVNDDDNSQPGIEQLQKELADLRRTVARLTQGKKV
ncbi:mucin-2 [Episyrphus balteatus]|uniref:mucin-2 n=1 Tax=Episyrphus balteatus TaxID=286459 RepID=UPI0024852B84|nr:mucin-2 [Episyrphus balteatus]